MFANSHSIGDACNSLISFPVCNLSKGISINSFFSLKKVGVVKIRGGINRSKKFKFKLLLCFLYVQQKCCDDMFSINFRLCV